MSERKPNFLIPAIGAAVIVAGGAGAYFYLGKGSLTASNNGLGNAQVVPSKALMAISISVDSNNWTQLEQFQTPETRKYFDASFTKLKQDALASSEIDFDKDIKPWAGNVMVAILPSAPKQASLNPNVKPSLTLVVDRRIQAQASPPKTGKEIKPNVLMVVEVKDKLSAAQFGEKVKAKSGKAEQKDYKGVQISTYKNKKGEPMSTALLGDYLVISPDKSVEQAIDTFKGEASLATEINSGDLDFKHPLMQFYMPKFAESIEQLAKLNPDSNLPPESIAQLKAIKSISMGIGVDNDGLRLKATTKLDPAIFKFEYKAASSKALAQFPSETFSIVTGSDINSRWKQIVQDAARNPDMQKGLDETRANLKQPPFGLDLDKDIFGWMTGEFALGVIANSEGILAQAGAGPVMTLQTSDRKTAEATIKKLEDFAKQNSVTVQNRDVKGVAVTEWSPSPGFTIGYGWYEQDSLFVTVGPLVNIMASKPSNSLENNQTFKTITSSFNKPNIGYFYLDMDKTWSLIDKMMPAESKAEITPEAKALIGTVRGIGVTAYMPDPTTNKFEALLSLKPKGGK